jgi:ribosomal protein L36
VRTTDNTLVKRKGRTTDNTLVKRKGRTTDNTLVKRKGRKTDNTNFSYTAIFNSYVVGLVLVCGV